MKIKTAAAAAACAVLLSGCSAGVSMETLLTAPKLTAEQSEIYQALTNSVGSAIKLKYPKSGDFRSAFVLYDIDNEAGEEALVFYESASVQSGESALRLKILDKSEGEWEAVFDLACAGSEVDSISFTRLGTSDSINIIIRYSLLNQTEKSFSVLNYENRALKELHTSSYSCLEFIDLNADGNEELVCVVADKSNGEVYAQMLTNDEKGFRTMSEIPLDAAVDYINITPGLLDENTPAMFMDGTLGAGQYSTDVLYCIGNSLVHPVMGGEEPSVISRFTNDYMGEILSRDIDSDGFIEIPSTVPLPGYEELPRAEQLCAVEWYMIDNNTYVSEYYSYYSGKYGFAFLFPEEWTGKVTARPDFAGNEIVFLQYDPRKGLDEATELFRVRSVDKADADAVAAANGLPLIAQSSDKFYYFNAGEGFADSKYALTEAEFAARFILL